MAQSSPPSGWTDAERPGKANQIVDIEKHAVVEAHLLNTTVRNISWKNVTVRVKDRVTKQPKTIVDNVEGIVEAGEICALMGPSGSGKTTLLNALARRPTGGLRTDGGGGGGTVLVNGTAPSRAAFRRTTRFVEQEDALLGALTVRETLVFASRLAVAKSRRNGEEHVDALLDAFGLAGQADVLVGTPLRKGVSGGQRRRLGVASRLVTSPKILFLDEPTSGLDSTASWEVIKYLRDVAKRNKLIVIASIHQPSTSTFNLFDKLLLLSEGKTHYFGPVADVADHYASLGITIPLHTNPAEFLLETVNTDFAAAGLRDDAARRLDQLQRLWTTSDRARRLTEEVDQAGCEGQQQGRVVGGDNQGASRSVSAATTSTIIPTSSNSIEEVGAEASQRPTRLHLVATLVHRSFVKSYRDVVAYGIRLAMYTGLAVMMGTVWLRLSTSQSSIIPLTNAIFYGSAFMSFMAVAYVPAFLEDRHQFVQEHRNGLYGALELVLANFLIGLPYLFVFAVVFSAISYWLSNFRPEATAFFTWVLWLFLDLVAAESLVVLVSAVFPSFVVSLALVAFANGLWMSVDGFMVSPTVLNVFYRYVFHYWDYQKYVFQNMMINEFAFRTYDCAPAPARGGGRGGCSCMFPTELEDQCRIAGQGVLDQYGYKPGHMGRDVGIMIGIIAGYRVAGWIALKLRA